MVWVTVSSTALAYCLHHVVTVIVSMLLLLLLLATESCRHVLVLWWFWLKTGVVKQPVLVGSGSCTSLCETSSLLFSPNIQSMQNRFAYACKGWWFLVTTVVVPICGRIWELRSHVWHVIVLHLEHVEDVQASCEMLGKMRVAWGWGFLTTVSDYNKDSIDGCTGYLVVYEMYVTIQCFVDGWFNLH